MQKLLIALLVISFSCFAGFLKINYNNTSTPSTVIDLNSIAGMEIVTTTPVPAEMVAVDSGTFMMGQPDPNIPHPGLSANEQPVHSVTLSSFYIGKYEVTQLEWVLTMGTNPSYYGGMNHPVERVSWYDIMVYCNKRSIAEGLTPCYTVNGSTNPTAWGSTPKNLYNPIWNAASCNKSANGYRLPTEAEWEFAARGGNSSQGYTYSGSNTLNDVSWNYTYSDWGTYAVGTKTPNELGIYDMSGNVWEWNWDRYGSYSSTAQTNPTGVETGDYRVLRGGACSGSYGTNQHRVTARLYDAPFDCSNGFDIIGFRLARTY